MPKTKAIVKKAKKEESELVWAGARALIGEKADAEAQGERKVLLLAAKALGCVFFRGEHLGRTALY